MKHIHAPMYLLVTLASAALAALQPVEAGSLDARSIAAVANQVLTSLTVVDASAEPGQVE